MGYDISDYRDIDPSYGSLEDVDELIAGLKSRNMHLMMDLVVNHTSDQHAWFLESRSSKDNPKRDWYIWKPPSGFEDDGTPIPPNNWMQLLGPANSAWTYDEKTKEFYLALFSAEQTDLNWENPEVREAVHDVMRFWLDRGCSGFRMDVINLISKDQKFPDAPHNMPEGFKYHNGSDYFANGPRMHEYLQNMHKEVLAKYDTITVGEMPFVEDEDEILRTVGGDAGELNMIFIFDIATIDNVPGSNKFSYQKWTAGDLSRIVTKWQRVMIERGGWNSIFLSNHDQPRAVSHYTDDTDENGFRAKGAKLLALMQTTLSGTVYVYQGEELGMRNVPLSWDASEYKDIQSINFWKKEKELYGDDTEKMKEAHELMNRKARDNSRTPMQWSDGPNAGFSAEGVTPWMRVNDDYTSVNAAAQVDGDSSKEDGGMSIFRFWERGIKNRKTNKDVFVYGDYQLISGEDDAKVFAYARVGEDGDQWVTVLNFSGEKTTFSLPEKYAVDSWVAGNYGPGKIEKETKGSINLEPWEGVLGKCIDRAEGRDAKRQKTA